MSDILIFDRNRVRHNRNRATRQGNAQETAAADFLHQWTLRAIADRLTLVKREFPLALLIGATGANTFQSEKIGSVLTMDLAENLRPAIQGDEEFLPFAPASFDAILSCLSLHTVNDLPGALLQIGQTLKPDGFFLGAMLGGETLYQLRQVMMEAEENLRGGLSPRIFPFADKPQAGALLQRAGFSLPVIDSEIVTATYENAFTLMHDLRLMGEGNAILNRNKTNPGKAFFLDVARRYQEKFAEADGRIPATFEIIFMLGWTPHESQQKPKARGSATHSLADRLGTTEHSTHEKTPA